jgi:hypothetical protein
MRATSLLWEVLKHRERLQAQSNVAVGGLMATAGGALGLGGAALGGVKSTSNWAMVFE